MLNSNSVKQLLQVLQLFRENYAGGMPPHSSCTEAVHTVAKKYSVAYQTIYDLCHRRLELTKDELDEMLSTWVHGEPSALLHRIKNHSDDVTHSEIYKFFPTPEPTTSPKPKPSVMSPPKDESEALSFRIEARDARSLRALAALEGISVGELTARVVSAAVHERMKAVAREYGT